MKKICIGDETVNAPTPDATLLYLYTLQQYQQEAFSKAGINNGIAPKGIERDERTQKRGLQLIEEVIELLRHINYKEHRATLPAGSADYDALLEWADCFKFLMIIGLERGWCHQDIIKAFTTKTIVADSYMRERALVDQPGEWIGFDIDDVLADYTGYFCERLHLDRTDIVNTKSIGEQCHLSKNEWEELKHDARSNGDFALMKANSSAVAATIRARQLGYKVVLITNRPVHEYPRLYSDTILWLNERHVAFDSVVFGSDKVMKIIQNESLQGRIKVFFDDHPENVAGLRSIGVRAVRVERPPRGDGNSVRLDHLSEWVKENIPQATIKSI